MSRLPVLFVSHGAPTFALEPGRAGVLLRELGARLPRPRAIVVVSPHWPTRGFAVGAHPQPPTLYDFGGFPPALYELQYPAPGDPQLAAGIVERLTQAGEEAALDPQRGFDHGAWVPLRHLYPQAGIPVVQVSMPRRLDAVVAWRLGATLAPLRDEGVLILASGSLTHNLMEFFDRDEGAEADYAREFVAWIRDALLRHDTEALLDWRARAPHAQRAHPTAEHFLPLLVAAGAAADDRAVEVLDGGILYGMLSMESYVLG